MKLLVRGDDFGFTKAVTYGIVDAIDNGVLRNTGLFTNMPSSALAASMMEGRDQVMKSASASISTSLPESPYRIRRMFRIWWMKTGTSSVLVGG